MVLILQRIYSNNFIGVQSNWLHGAASMNEDTLWSQAFAESLASIIKSSEAFSVWFD